MSANVNLAQKVIEHIKCASVIAEKANKMANEKSAQDKAIADKIPTVVEALVQNGLITSDLVKDASAALADPVRALDVLLNTARWHQQNKEAGHLGEAVDDGKQTRKSASANRGGLDSPYCGGRVGGKRQSDLMFEQKVLGRNL